MIQRMKAFGDFNTTHTNNFIEANDSPRKVLTLVKNSLDHKMCFEFPDGPFTVFPYRKLR